MNEARSAALLQRHFLFENAEETKRRIAELNDYACPRERHPDRRTEQNDVVPCQIDETPVANPMNERPVDEQLKGAGDNPKTEKSQHGFAAPTAQGITGPNVEACSNEQPGIRPELSRDREGERVSRDQREKEPDACCCEPCSIRLWRKLLHTAQKARIGKGRHKSGHRRTGVSGRIIRNRRRPTLASLD